MTTKLGRNEPCPCGKRDGNDKPIKYKKCCLDGVKSGKFVFKTVTRNDFISGPYKHCPGCDEPDTFGVFTPIGGSTSYTRECTACGHEKKFALPKLEKKVIYLDQFVISNLVKLLDKDHPSHARVVSDPFWSELFEKLEKASKSQAIICPDSFYHREESVVGGMDFRLVRRLYEHFSSGKTLYPGATVQRFQIEKHFANWLKGNKTEFIFDPQDIAFDRDLYEWNIGLTVSVGGKLRPGERVDQERGNISTKLQLEKIWRSWEDSDMSFADRVQEETLALGKGTVNAIRDFEFRRSVAMQKIATDPTYEIDINDILPPSSSDLIDSLTSIASRNGIQEDQIYETIGRYLGDAESLLDVPSIKISSVMFAGLARCASLGDKTPPKSTADVHFISSYLPYCDAMFVDIQSKKLMEELPKDVSSKLRLTGYKAEVFSLRQKQEFLDYLDNLVENLPAEQVEALRDMNGDNYFKPFWEIIEYEKRTPRDAR